MVDLLVVWGVTQAVGFVFKPILEDLAKESAKDFAKDFFKDSLKNVLRLPAKEPLDIAAGKAIKEFLQLVQQELEDADVSEEELKHYTQPLKQFIRDKSVKAILGSAFNDDCQGLDTKTFAKIWYQLDLACLPEDFEWERVAKRYLKKVKAIIRESDELRAILDSQKLEGIEQNTKELAGIVPEFDLRRYQEGLRQSNELEAKFDPEEWERYKQVYYQQPVRSVLDVVNEMWNDPPQPPLIRGEYLPHQSSLVRGEKNSYSLGKTEEQDSTTVPPLVRGARGVNAECNKIVILGDPGSGKSMLLQYLALNWANSPLNNVIELPIPLLIELRSYSRDRISGQCKDFLEFCHNGNVICRLNQHQLHERLKAGKVLVMFDGLDEVFDPAQRDDVITDIHRFTNEYPNVRVIVTSRIIGYKPQRLRDAEFRHFMMQDLESEQIQDFIYRWHELTFTDETDKVRKRERLQQAINTSKAIGELAGNPLLLTMMAILNRNQELPRDRPELYNQALRVLLHQWDVEQKLLENPKIDSVAIDYKDKQTMLRQVAYHMQAADKGLAGNLIRGEDLERILTGYLKSIEVSQARTIARLLIEQLRSRNFILCFLGADAYGFVHRTFLEYFCASEFVERFGKRGIEGGLTLEELKTEVFGKHWQDESWHEVLRLIAGMIDTSFAGEIIDYLMALGGEEEKFINLFLAAECLSDVRNQAAIASTVAKLLKQLHRLMGYGIFISSVRSDRDIEHNNRVTKIRTQAVAAIAITWKDDPDTLSWLKQQVQAEHNATVRCAAVQALARGWKDNPSTLSWLKQQVDLLKQQAQANDFKVVRLAVVQELARGWKDEPSILPWLKQRAQADDDWSVRYAAVQELAHGWKDDPDTLVILKQKAQADDNEYVRQVAVQELARGWKDDSDTLAILKQKAQADDNEYVRRASVQELARGWKDDPDTLPWLKQRAQADDDGGVRYAAVQELARGWKDDPDTLPWLKQWAQADDDGDVRQAAMQELARGWKDDPDTLPILKQRAQADDYGDARYAAVRELANGWKYDPDTLPILKTCALLDKDGDTRYMAVQELVNGWKDEPWMFEFLCNVSLNDPFERKKDWERNPRQTALEAIVKQYRDHSKTLPLLQDRVENDPDEELREFAKKKLAELEE